MISSNYVSLALNPKGSPPPPCVNKDNLPESFGQCSSLVCRRGGRGGAGAPVRGVGPICTVTCSLVPCLQQEVEPAQSGLGYCAPGVMHARVLWDCRMSRSCWLISKRKKAMQVWVCGCVYNCVHRCIPFQLCSCLCAFFVSLWFACLRDHNDSLSIKTESCVDRRGWEVYEAYKHSCILHVDKWSLRKGLRNENWQECEECRKSYISLWVFRPHRWND